MNVNQVKLSIWISRVSSCIYDTMVHRNALSMSNENGKTDNEFRSGAVEILFYCPIISNLVFFKGELPLF